MTTTGAAKYQSLVRQLGCRVVVFEEAAEVGLHCPQSTPAMPGLWCRPLLVLSTSRSTPREDQGTHPSEGVRVADLFALAHISGTRSTRTRISYVVNRPASPDRRPSAAPAFGRLSRAVLELRSYRVAIRASAQQWRAFRATAHAATHAAAGMFAGCISYPVQDAGTKQRRSHRRICAAYMARIPANTPLQPTHPYTRSHGLLRQSTPSFSTTHPCMAALPCSPFRTRPSS